MLGSAFCGWFEPDGRPDSGRETSATMAQRFAQTHDVEQLSCAEAKLGLSFQTRGLVSSHVADDNYYVVFSGRATWKDHALRDLSRQHGDACALLQAYRNAGTRSLHAVGGAFSFALIDKRAEEVFLAVDRMGILPLSYSIRPGTGIAFGTSAEAVDAHPAFASAVSEQAVLSYLFYHVVPSPVSVFEAQRKLPPGHYLHYANHQPVVEQYWMPEFAQRSDRRFDDLADELHNVLRSSVARCSNGDRIGAFLSGGIDSSSIAGMLSEIKPDDARTYTIGFEASGYDEIEYAQATSNHFNTHQHQYYVTPDDVVTAIPRIVDTYDEPFGNSSAVPVYFCARLAKSDDRAALLAGDGGDELFGGNVRYTKQRVFAIYDALPGAVRKSLLEPLFLDRAWLDGVPLLRKAKSYVSQACVPMPDRLETYNFLHRTACSEILHADLIQSTDQQAPIALMRETYAYGHARSMLDKMLFLDWKQALADNDIRKVNRMCEAAGIRVCYPFLDDEVVDFSLRLPASLKVRGFKLRYFFKRAMQDYLPSKVLHKPKHGFGLPFGVWMSAFRPLQELAYDSISDLKQRRYLRADYLDRLVQQHREDHAAYFGEFIWVLMMLELWLKKKAR